MKQFTTIIKSLFAMTLLMVPSMAMAETVTFGFNRTMTAPVAGATTGVCGDVILDNVHDALSLSLVESHNSSIRLVGGGYTFTYNGVTYKTTGSADDYVFQMGGTFTVNDSTNYFGYDVTLAEGYTFTPTKADVLYRRMAKGLGYEIDIINLTTKERVKVGAIEDRSSENVSLSSNVTGYTMKSGNKYRVIVRQYGWNTSGWAIHVPLKFQLTGNVAVEATKVESKITSIGISGLTVTKGTDTDYVCNMPMEFSNATTNITAICENGTLAATAVDQQGNTVTITDNGDGTFSLPTPDITKTTLVTFSLTPNANAVTTKKTITLKIFHIGEIALTNLTLNGKSFDILSIINAAPYTATATGCVFTTLPVVTATGIDGSAATVTYSMNGSTAVYSIQSDILGKTRTFTLNVEDVHLYTKKSGDESVSIKFGSGTTTRNEVQKTSTWTNGLYTMTCSAFDGYLDAFKFNSNDYTISLPADAVVRQFILHDFRANYKGVADGKLVNVTSEGATSYIPSKHNYKHPDEQATYDLIVNIYNYTAGSPLNFTISGGGQPMAWIELVVEHVAVTSAPVLLSQTVTSTEHTNHAVVTLSFDREMKATTASIAGQSITAEGGSTKLVFPVWNLQYDSSNSLVIAAGSAHDNYGNINTEAISVDINVGSKTIVDKVTYDFIVEDVDDFKKALASVNSTNITPDAPRKTIFILNGSYDFGSEGQLLNAYNVSFIGESHDGVILHGIREAIKSPVFDLGARTGTYVQDLIVRNDLNYGTDNLRGVGVALAGGNKAVLKNVSMQSHQDTQVTGTSAYYENCHIHGTVDFICGGGNQFYESCDLIIEGGAVITAPNHPSSIKWGYVFNNCTVKSSKIHPAGNGSYTLGRPWQNEPRCYFLNTIMEITPSASGWAGMSNIPNHFYEYNSRDAKGNAVDLSGRKNSPTDYPAYKPVLTDEEAARFTLHNVLGSTDSWLPTELCYTAKAVNLTAKGNILSWEATDDARCYVILLDGKYVANTTDTSFTVTTAGNYTVRPANVCGGMGTESNSVSIPAATALSVINADNHGKANALYNLQGQPIACKAPGIVIDNGKKVVME